MIESVFTQIITMTISTEFGNPVAQTKFRSNFQIDWNTFLSQDSVHSLSHLICNTWASYQIGKIAGCACAWNPGNVSHRRRFQRKPLVSDPGMHHGTCVTHVPWCMSGSLTCGDGKNVPGIPTRNFTYLARGPWAVYFQLSHFSCGVCENMLRGSGS